MKTDKQDTKSLHSKAAIKGAFTELLTDYPPEKITVSLLCKKAGINRGTFYIHYYNIKDVYDELVNSFLDQIREKLNEFDFAKLNEDSFHSIIKIIFDNESISNTLLNTLTDADLINIITTLFEGKILSDFKAEYPQLNDEETKTFFYFVVGGASFLIVRWFHGNRTTSIRKVSETLSEYTNLLLNYLLDKAEKRKAEEIDSLSEN